MCNGLGLGTHIIPSSEQFGNVSIKIHTPFDPAFPLLRMYSINMSACTSKDLLQQYL